MKNFYLALLFATSVSAALPEREIINRGTYENDGTGEGRFSAYGKINTNFDSVWSFLEDPSSVGAVALDNIATNSAAWRAKLGIGSVPVNVTADPYNATGNGTTDDYQAIQAAIDAAGEGSSVYLPAGTYRITAGLLLNNHIQTLYGDGARATYIYYDPASAGSALTIKGDSEIYQVQVRGIGLRCDPDSIVQKIAIEAYDISHSLIDDVEVYPWSGPSTNNIGLWLRGRDTTVIRRPVIRADIPVKISPNPENSISIDQVNFTDCEFICDQDTGACILIDAGVNLTEVTFGGFQTWSMGKYGLYWRDTNNLSASLGLHISGMRREQCQDTNGYSVYIERGYGLRDAGAGNVLQNFTLRDTYLDTFQHGVYLRGVNGATFDHVWFSQSAYEQLNADDTCQSITLTGCFSQQSGTAPMTGLTNMFQFPTALGGTPLPEAGVWLRSTGGNQPLKLSTTTVRGQLRINTDTTSDALLRIEQDEDELDDPGYDIRPMEFVREDATNQATPRRIVIPAIHKVGGVDNYIGALIFERPNGNGGTYSSMDLAVNYGSALMDECDDLQPLLRLDGGLRRVQARLEDDSTNGAALWPLSVTRTGTNTFDTARSIGMTFDDRISGVNAYLASIKAVRENSEGNALSSLKLGINLQTSVFPTSPDDMTYLLHLNGQYGWVGLGVADALKVHTDGSQSILDVDNALVRVRTAYTPSSATDTGTPGQIGWDTNYVYVCTGTNEWKRAALSTWP